MLFPIWFWTFGPDRCLFQRSVTWLCQRVAEDQKADSFAQCIWNCAANRHCRLPSSCVLCVWYKTVFNPLTMRYETRIMAALAPRMAVYIYIYTYNMSWMHSISRPPGIHWLGMKIFRKGADIVVSGIMGVVSTKKKPQIAIYAVRYLHYMAYYMY